MQIHASYVGLSLLQLKMKHAFFCFQACCKLQPQLLPFAQCKHAHQKLRVPPIKHQLKCSWLRVQSSTIFHQKLRAQSSIIKQFRCKFEFGALNIAATEIAAANSNQPQVSNIAATNPKVPGMAVTNLRPNCLP